MNSLKISGYNSKLTTSTLLYELFCQGGPIKSIILCKRPDEHAIIRFQHDESVPYCLALFEGVELHGRLLRMNPLKYNKNTYMYTNYLREVRHKFRDEYAKIDPPALPPKICSNDRLKYTKDRRSNKKRKLDLSPKKDKLIQSDHKNIPSRKMDPHKKNPRSNKLNVCDKESSKTDETKPDKPYIRDEIKRTSVEKKNTRRKPSQKQRRRNNRLMRTNK